MLYGQTYNAVNVNSNGRLDFVVVNEPGGYLTSCLPAPPNVGPYDYTIFGLWHDLRTDTGLSGCSTWANGCGIFTSVSGTAPNRIFNIEWHAVEFANNANTANFEVRLYENSVATNEQFDINLRFERSSLPGRILAVSKEIQTMGSIPRTSAMSRHRRTSRALTP